MSPSASCSLILAWPRKRSKLAGSAAAYPAGGAWSQAADPAGTAGYYHITWMAHVPGGQTSLAIGSDLKNGLLLSEG